VALERVSLSVNCVTSVARCPVMKVTTPALCSSFAGMELGVTRRLALSRRASSTAFRTTGRQCHTERGGIFLPGPIAALVLVATMLDHEFAHSFMMRRLGYSPGRSG